MDSSSGVASSKKGNAISGVVLPLALAQFIASFAASNMNVAINSIAADLGTTVIGVQTAITLFTLVMAALMIPGSKLTDIWGRKLCLMLGLSIYGLGALVASFAPHLGVMIFGYSILEGIGSALMIPPIYIMITVFFTDTTSRAKNFGIISAAAGIGSAAGPLIGGLVTSLVSWRASFLLQVLVVGTIILLSRKINDSPLPDKRPAFDIGGAVLSAAGMVLVVMGTLLSSTYGWFKSRQDFSLFGKVLIHQGGISPVWLFIGIGVIILFWFYRHIRMRENSGETPLLSTRLFHNTVSNLGLVTQNMQWLVLQGSFFVVSVFLQTVRGYSAIQTGLALTPATAGILLASAAAPRLARNHPQTKLVRWGFMITMLGMALLLLFARAHASILAYSPGLFAMGLGVGVMLTSSVNIVQSSFPEKDQGEISGLSRSVSNLGSSFGTALAGSVLVSTLVEGNKHFILALLVMFIASGVGLLAAFRLPVAQKAAQ
jgi:MFS family permease